MSENSKILMDFVRALRDLNYLYSQRQLENIPIKSFLLKVEFEGDGQGYMWKSNTARSVQADLNTAIGLILSHPITEYTRALAPFYTLVRQLFDAKLAKSGELKEYIIACQDDSLENPKIGIAASRDFIQNLIDILPVVLEVLREQREEKFPENVVPFTSPTKH